MAWMFRSRESRSLAQGQQNGFLKDGSVANRCAGRRKRWAYFSPDHPEKVAPSLAQGLQETNALVAQVSASQLSEEAKYDILHELRSSRISFSEAIASRSDFRWKRRSRRRKNRRATIFSSGPTETFAYAVPGQDFDVKIHLDNPREQR